MSTPIRNTQPRQAPNTNQETYSYQQCMRDVSTLRAHGNLQHQAAYVVTGTGITALVTAGLVAGATGGVGVLPAIGLAGAGATGVIVGNRINVSADKLDDIADTLEGICPTFQP
jgi:hypothetical protein